MKSTRARSGIHAAIIMDGNGRWANARGLPRIAGHRTGAEAVRRTVEAAPSCGISVLTLYAFSSDNWRRPGREVSALMKLLGRYLAQECERCIANGVRLEAIGRRDRLPPALLALLEETERKTSAGRRLLLRLAIDYSSREAIVQALRRLSAENDMPRLSIENDMRRLSATRDTRPTLGPASEEPHHHDEAITAEKLSAQLGPDVDLLIRTSGEQRLSDFLLWECAYAEIVFTGRMWPDFSAKDLTAAVEEFHSRDRRFGAVASTGALRTA